MNLIQTKAKGEEEVKGNNERIKNGRRRWRNIWRRAEIKNKKYKNLDEKYTKNSIDVGREEL